MLTKHSFKADESDHYETSYAAWNDVAVVLRQIAKLLNKSLPKLSVYDPFFCEGAVKKHLDALGFEGIINENKDFYKTVENKKVPAYDVLATNPPYSKGHKERALTFCVKSAKPWVMLLPNYACAAPYYSSILSSRGAADRPFFLAPDTKYEYKHRDPNHKSNIKNQSSPFLSWWIVDFPKKNQFLRVRCREIFKAQKKAIAVLSEQEAFDLGMVPQAMKADQWAVGVRHQVSTSGLRVSGARSAPVGCGCQAPGQHQWAAGVRRQVSTSGLRVSGASAAQPLLLSFASFGHPFLIVEWHEFFESQRLG
ncbi:hypothetical protein CYMTET_29452 [Cymbomonas tetramitiformis]|uniref:Uncharacterized protein n=1 Tax=Cymbomonas tetramitiformis TaxID=36881 RepID=A0AAE0KV53_9CHLO|nr:hypothetical protein CYMTET_29452 [Cymbomonas tetramitiformis]